MAEYDEMTPYELGLCIESYSEELKQETESKYRIAHATAYWHRVETLKSFNEEWQEEKDEKDKEMSMEQMLANVMKLNAEMNGQVIEENTTTE
jgi:hypothetical protein